MNEWMSGLLDAWSYFVFGWMDRWMLCMAGQVEVCIWMDGVFGLFDGWMLDE